MTGNKGLDTIQGKLFLNQISSISLWVLFFSIFFYSNNIPDFTCLLFVGILFLLSTFFLTNKLEYIQENFKGVESKTVKEHLVFFPTLHPFITMSIWGILISFSFPLSTIPTEPFSTIPLIGWYYKWITSNSLTSIIVIVSIETILTIKPKLLTGKVQLLLVMIHTPVVISMVAWGLSTITVLPVMVLSKLFVNDRLEQLIKAVHLNKLISFYIFTTPIIFILLIGGAGLFKLSKTHSGKD